MHDFAARTEHRLSRFIDERLTPQIYRARVGVQLEAWEAPGEPVPFAEAREQRYTEVGPGYRWARPWGTTWFRLTGEVPAAWAGADGVELEIVVDLGFTGGPGFTCEGQVRDAEGRVVKAVHPENRWVPVTAAPGERFEFYLEAAANPVVAGNWYTPTPMGDPATAGGEPLYALGAVDLAQRDVEVWELARDVEVLRGLMLTLPGDSTRRAQLRAGFERLLDAVDPLDLAATASRGREVLAPLLAAPAARGAHVVHAVGHAHIDSAWLWPVRETVRKCVRTFGNVVALMDDHPDLIFACSSAQQYAWVQEADPELFERIRHYVTQGRFVPVGGMWVESDTNLPGGEAMARQFVAGTRYFVEELGVEPREVWLPDSFGYSAAMPQIARAAGKESFLTQKISWNDTNAFPHHTFWWEGIDGTRIFTHFPPADTYNSRLSADELHRSERQFREKGQAVHALVPFGWGDGGGGPTREMLADGRRQGDLEGSPRVVLDTPTQFFDAAKAEYPNPDTWTGELYLEYHRGTYTSQHPTKAGNRRSEHLLREAELWWTTAVVRHGVEYPAAALERLWRLVLLQQFHDILPGSSIAWVHRDAERNYAAIAAELEGLIGQAIGVLAGEGERPLRFNARPQPDAGVPALGAGEPSAPASATTVEATDGGFRLSNDGFVVLVDANGLVTSLIDRRAGRELVPAGERLGLLQLHRDMPNEWDAWDINHFYTHNVVDLVDADRVRVIEGGLEIVRATADSRFVERLRLEEAGLRFAFDIDWHERQRLLKLHLPLDLHAAQASSEIQFGHLQRPTAVNTSWDAARFETVAHRWVHVAEPGYGVALANSATYGYAIDRVSDGGGVTTTRVRPSLLRAPRFPDPEADQGRHELEFLLVPGAGLDEAVAAGYALNLPPREVRGAADVEPLVVVDHPGVAVEAVKLAEDGSGDVVVRLYETRGGRARATVTPGFETTGAVGTDLLERPDDAGERGTSPVLDLRPFQIVTLRFAR